MNDMLYNRMVPTADRRGVSEVRMGIRMLTRN